MFLTGMKVSSQTSSLTQNITLTSTNLHESMSAMIGLPNDYQTTKDQYPVVFILDGETYFDLTCKAAAELLTDHAMPPCIVVGITSHHRQKDFTTPVTKGAGQDADISTSGGANPFLDYIEKELIPAIAKKYRTQPQYTLIGHSLGGLLVYHALYTKPGLFKAYISIDGSLWWNKGSVGKSAIDFLSHHPLIKTTLFECRKDITQPVRFPVNVELLNYLAQNRPIGLHYKYVELKDKNHATIVLPGIYQGLRFAFANR